MQYLLYDAPSWPDVPYEHDGRGIFLKEVTAAHPSGKVLVLEPAGFLKRKLVYRLQETADEAEYRKLVRGAYTAYIAGVFGDVNGALVAAGFRPENAPMDVEAAARICACTNDERDIAALMQVFREFRPRALFGGDIDWVLVLVDA